MINVSTEPVTSLPGVGEKRKEALQSLGIVSIYDLLTHYPFRYEDLAVKQLAVLEDKEKTSLRGLVIAEPVVSHFGHRKSRLTFRIVTEEKAVVSITFFNQPYVKKWIVPEQEIVVQGIWNAKTRSLNGTKVLSPEELESLGSMAPIYPTTKEVKQYWLVQLIEKANTRYNADLIDLIPEELKDKYRLLDYRHAVTNMHFPKTMDDLRQARRTLVFGEFFLYQLKLQAVRKNERQANKGRQVLYDVDKLKHFLRSLPFELTGAQKRSINEICRDLRMPIQMNRLLQGDVGSGKTIVAAAALYAVSTIGFQSALMVPTEILAEQHFKSLTTLFSDTDIKVALLTSSLKPKEKKEMYRQLHEGDIDIVVGTHALIQEKVHFQQLGFVITDEQHRFGVNQRQRLTEKGHVPDVLSMTATPIPRTLEITTYGDIDVSTLDEMPVGRLPIQTHWLRPGQSERVLEVVTQHLEDKSQVYVVSPLIEESEKMDLKNVTDLKEKYAALFEPTYTVELLHGKLAQEEKEAIMQQFKHHEIDILVSTTVIEVGVDVPNATLMVVYDADRFGLAQLHQLRGRVGRGTKASMCVLVAEPRTDTGKERMKIMTETNDGFLLSQRDLELRGPGDVFGRKQSGIPEFKVADVLADNIVLEIAREEAYLLGASSDFYVQEHYRLLREQTGFQTLDEETNPNR